MQRLSWTRLRSYISASCRADSLKTEMLTVITTGSLSFTILVGATIHRGKPLRLNISAGSNRRSRALLETAAERRDLPQTGPSDRE